MTADNTTGLREGDPISFEMSINISGVITIVQFHDKLVVKDRYFPGT
jgi:hypothetical protein